MKYYNKYIAIIFILFLNSCSSTKLLSASNTIKFSGYEWNVRNGHGGPGDNEWLAKNVWVDEDGMHLTISRDGDQYSCAEVYTTEAFGFGSYQFQIVGRIDSMNENVVLGLFNYSSDSKSKTNEIDIEFTNLSKWNKSGNAIYSVYPSVLIKNYKNVYKDFQLELNGSFSTHRFTWEHDNVFFQSLHGHTNNNSDEINSWHYKNSEAPEKYIPQKPLPVHINLWLHDNTNLDIDKYEVVIKRFKYVE